MDVDLDATTVTHEPPTEHPPNTPLVVYADVTLAAGQRAILHYRTRARWHTAPMRAAGDGYVATIPCDAVRRRGNVSYYIEILDEAGNAVAAAGSQLEPYVVPIEEGASATAHVPNEAPPKACKESKESEGEAAPEESPEEPSGPAPAAKPSRPSAWLSVTLSQDTQIASGDDVCAKSSQLESGYSCFRAQGSQYLGTPQSGTGGQGGGFEFATTRVLAGLDYAIANRFTIGARAGYVLRGGGPKPAGGSAFLPLHAEGRMSYWFSDHAYDNKTVSPFVLAAFGIGQIDSSSDVTVKENTSVPPPTAQLDNPPSQTLEAWKKSGVGFAALGVGAYLAIGETQGFLGEIRGAYLFPSPGIAFTGSVGYAFGL